MEIVEKLVRLERFALMENANRLVLLLSNVVRCVVPLLILAVVRGKMERNVSICQAVINIVVFVEKNALLEKLAVRELVSICWKMHKIALLAEGNALKIIYVVKGFARISKRIEIIADDVITVVVFS